MKADIEKWVGFNDNNLKIEQSPPIHNVRWILLHSNMLCHKTYIRNLYLLCGWC